MLRRVAPLIPAALLVALAAGCTPTIAVDAAPDAANPKCAPVMLALPDVLDGDLHKARTMAQATAAWGSGGAAVTLRCGVTPPGASADCQQVESGKDTIDWIVQAGDNGTWRFTTYGRNPAVEVTIPGSVHDTHSSSFVADLGQAVALVEATKTCS